LPRKMWESIQFEIDPTIAAASTMLVAVTGALFLTAELLRRRAERLRTEVPSRTPGRSGNLPPPLLTDGSRRP
jgi:putative spermidine/putrescine transport system permease protein